MLAEKVAFTNWLTFIQQPENFQRQWKRIRAYTQMMYVRRDLRDRW